MALKNAGLGLHFFLELAALAGLAVWGFQPAHSGWQKILLGIVVPVLAAAVWGIFRVPNDPGQAVVAVPGILRLILELGILGGAAFGLYAAGHTPWAVLFAAAIVIDYGIMYERVVWLIRV
jgi:hypothetical protein